MPKQDSAKGWTVAQRKFMFYLATPQGERAPRTETAYARQEAVNPATLWKWKQIPGFWAEVNKLVDEHFLDDYSKMVDALKREARRGQFNHLRMYFEMAGKYTPRQEVTGKDGEPLFKVYRDIDVDKV